MTTSGENCLPVVRYLIGSRYPSDIDLEPIRGNRAEAETRTLTEFLDVVGHRLLFAKGSKHRHECGS